MLFGSSAHRKLQNKDKWTWNISGKHWDFQVNGWISTFEECWADQISAVCLLHVHLLTFSLQRKNNSFNIHCNPQRQFQIFPKKYKITGSKMIQKQGMKCTNSDPSFTDELRANLIHILQSASYPYSPTQLRPDDRLVRSTLTWLQLLPVSNI